MSFVSRISRDASIVAGVKDLSAAAIAMVAWGSVTGVAMVQSGLTPWQAVGMSFLVYAGSAQLASLPLFAVGAPLPIVWVSALVVNLRFVIYSVAFKPFFKPLSAIKRLIYGSASVDAMAAEFLNRFSPTARDHGVNRLTYFKAGSSMIWAVWQASSLAGIFLASMIPASWGLEFVATLALIAMLAPMIVDRASLACIAVAGSIALLAHSLPLNLGLLLAVMGGVAAAMILDRQ